MSHLRKSLNVAGTMAIEDFNAALDIVNRAYTAGKISFDSLIKAQGFLMTEANRKPIIKRSRVELAVCYCLIWLPAIGAMGYSVIHRMQGLGLLR